MAKLAEWLGNSTLIDSPEFREHIGIAEGSLLTRPGTPRTSCAGLATLACAGGVRWQHLRVLRWIMGIGAIGLFCLWIIAIAFRVETGAYEFTSKFKTIKRGTPIEDALELLGDPTDISDDFYLGQKEGYEDSYQRAHESHAIKFYVWRCCLDMTYTLGVNKEGSIVVTEYGGT